MRPRRGGPRAPAVPILALALLVAHGPGTGLGAQPRGQAAGGGLAGPARALPDTDSLGILEAVERALAHYPTVGASEAAVAAARAGRARAGSAWWPELGVRGSATRFQDPMVVGPIHDFRPGQTPAFDRTLIQGEAYLRWLVFDGGGRRARIRRAEWEASAAEADLDGATQSLVAEVATAYLEVLSRERVLAAHDRRIAALGAELQRVRRLREVGRAARVEALRVEAALASARSERVSVASGLDVARRELARLVGAPTREIEASRLSRVRLIDPAPPVRDEAAAVAVESNPEVEAARRRRRAAEAGLELARSDRWPDLSLVGAWTDYTGLDSDHQLEWSTGVGLSLPIVTGGRIGEGIAAADAEARAAEERLRLAVTRAEGEMDRALSRVQETDARLRSLETAVARSREVVRIERLRLETGTGTQTDYLDAEAALLAVEAALFETRHAAIGARIRLALNRGRLSPHWLSENLETEP